MLVVSILGVQNATIQPQILQHLEDLIASKIVIPVRTFAQYINSGTQHAENAEHIGLIEKHFGTDIAKSVTTITLIESFDDAAPFLAKVVRVLEQQMDCRIIPGIGKTVYLYDIQKEKILHTYENSALVDYQTKVSPGNYVSKLGHVALVESQTADVLPLVKPKFSLFRN